MNVFVYDSLRTVRGKGTNEGSLMGTPPVELGRQVINQMVVKNNLKTKYIDDLIFGCVTQIGDQGSNIAKACIDISLIGSQCGGVTLNRFCGSGLEAINQGVAYVKSGYKNMVLAGGVESMSRVPMSSDGGAYLLDPKLTLDGFLLPQGVAADVIATKYNVLRHDLDQYAVLSHERALKARESKDSRISRIPIKDVNGFNVLETDEIVRNTTIEDLKNLPPSFELHGKKMGFDSTAFAKYSELNEVNHLHHAGNSSALADGASVTLLGNAKLGKIQNIKPKAKIKAMALVGSDPTLMLTGVVPATIKVLKQAKMKISDIDLFEVNEAFAVVPLYFMEQLNVPISKVNVYGGSIALGHPLGATGSVLFSTLIDALHHSDKNIGLVTLCMGGGMGIATIVERL